MRVIETFARVTIRRRHSMGDLMTWHRLRPQPSVSTRSDGSSDRDFVEPPRQSTSRRCADAAHATEAAKGFSRNTLHLAQHHAHRVPARSGGARMP